MPTRMADAVAEALIQLEVTTAFGLMSEDTAELIIALDRRGVTYYAAHHENVAVNMADGYSWRTDDIGVAIIGRGPGLTNGLTALTTAAKADRPVLVITGAGALGDENPMDAKGVSQAALADVVGVVAMSPKDKESVLPQLREAVATARRGRTVLFSIPVNVLTGTFIPHAESVEKVTSSEGTSPSPRPSGSLTEAAEMLSGASLPLYIAGRGACNPEARSAIVALAERTGGLLGTSLLAKDLFRGHPADVGVIGGFARTTSRAVIQGVDCVVAFGASLNQYTRGFGTLFDHAPVIHVDIRESSLGKFGRTDVGVVGDAGVVAKELVAAVTSHRALDEAIILRLRNASYFPSEDQSTVDAVDPRALSSALDKLLPQERNAIVCDGGNFFGFPATALHVSEPGTFRLTEGFLSIGGGLGAAMGAAIARPELPTVLCIGDGGLRMTLGDLATASRYGLPLIIIVYNDHAYGAERVFLEIEGMSWALSQFPDDDFAGSAAAVGVTAATVRSLGDLEKQAHLLDGSSGPVLLDCKVNGDVPGQFLVEMTEHRLAQQPSS
jgi:acetolactate synthase-1/2/3 large subunit